ncbi:MAG: Uma2 family endonuclease [Thermomicrobiales bacterium]
MAMTQLMTVKDLEQLPEDGYRYELLQGELVRMPPPGFRHGKRAIWIGKHFLEYALVAGGEVTTDSGFILHGEPDTVLGPDIAYVRAEHVPPEAEQDRYLHLAPDVVVEIVSPSDRPGYLRDKVAAYREAGVRLVVLADAFKRRLFVHSWDGDVIELADDDTFDGGDVMPGFRLPVSEFFR